MISTVSKVIVRACVCVLPSSTSPSRLLENGLSKLIQIGSIPKTYNPPNIKSPIIGVKSMWQDVASNKMVFQSSPLPESRASSSNWVCPKMGYTPQFDAKLHQVPHENYTLFIGYPYFQTLPDIMFFATEWQSVPKISPRDRMWWRHCWRLHRNPCSWAGHPGVLGAEIMSQLWEAPSFKAKERMGDS
jgi:hypothetical protein